MSNTRQPKGILKKPKPPHEPMLDDDKKSGVLWDEANIMLTESQKDSTMKVNEPKTPFLYYDSDSDTVEPSRTVGPGPMSSDELQSALQGAVTRGEIRSYGDYYEVEEPMDHEPDKHDVDDEQFLSPEDRAKKDKFRKLRSSHYNMRSALQQKSFDDDDGEDNGVQQGKGSSSSSKSVPRPSKPYSGDIDDDDDDDDTMDE